jgi:hypothetical protein
MLRVSRTASLAFSFLRHADRPLVEDQSLLGDAIGRIAPVHLGFITSWTVFQAVMEIRCRGKQGLRKICRKKYILQETPTGREADLSLDFQDAVLPGKVSMSLAFKQESKEQSIRNLLTIVYQCLLVVSTPYCILNDVVRLVPALRGAD